MQSNKKKIFSPKRKNGKPLSLKRSNTFKNQNLLKKIAAKLMTNAALSAHSLSEKEISYGLAPAVTSL